MSHVVSIRLWCSFHTYDYARHFVSACTRILGLEGTPEGVEDQGKLTRVAAVWFFSHYLKGCDCLRNLWNSFFIFSHSMLILFSGCQAPLFLPELRKCFDCPTVSYWHWSWEVHSSPRDGASQVACQGTPAFFCWEKGIISRENIINYMYIH